MVWTSPSPFARTFADRARRLTPCRDHRGEGSSHLDVSSGEASTGWAWRNRMIRVLLGAALACVLGGLVLSAPVAASGHATHGHAHRAVVRLDRPVTTERSAR